MHFNKFKHQKWIHSQFLAKTKTHSMLPDYPTESSSSYYALIFDFFTTRALIVFTALATTVWIAFLHAIHVKFGQFTKERSWAKNTFHEFLSSSFRLVCINQQPAILSQVI